MELTGCPRLTGIQIISRKWSYLLLRALRTPQIFSDLKREFSVVTNRMLSEELKQLVEEGLVQHANRVYSLTEAGNAFLVAAEPLHTWAAKYQKLPACSQQLACSQCARYRDFVRARLTN